MPPQSPTTVTATPVPAAAAAAPAPLIAVLVEEMESDTGAPQQTDQQGALARPDRTRRPVRQSEGILHFCLVTAPFYTLKTLLFTATDMFTLALSLSAAKWSMDKLPLEYHHDLHSDDVLKYAAVLLLLAYFIADMKQIKTKPFHGTRHAADIIKFTGVHFVVPALLVALDLICPTVLMLPTVHSTDTAIHDLIHNPYTATLLSIFAVISLLYHERYMADALSADLRQPGDIRPPILTRFLGRRLYIGATEPKRVLYAAIDTMILCLSYEAAAWTSNQTGLALYGLESTPTRILAMLTLMTLLIAHTLIDIRLEKPLLVPNSMMP